MAQDLRNKLMQKVQSSKLLKDSREFDNLIKAIGECKSKLEEDRIISAELELLKQVRALALCHLWAAEASATAF
jgi:hypothetical protein